MNAPPSIKNLISMFENQSKVQKTIVVPKKNFFNEFKSKQVTEAFDSFKRNRRHSSDDRTNELEKMVSVKTLVYNFQKLSAKANSQPIRRNSLIEAPRPLAETRLTWLGKKIIPDKKSPSSDPSKQPPTSSSLAESPRIDDSASIPPQNESISEPLKYKESLTHPKSYSFDSGSVQSESFDDDEELWGDGISNLPESYKIVPSNEKGLNLELPPPPEKSVFKKNNNKTKKSIKFAKVHEEVETYSKDDYVRGDDSLDESSSLAEYHIEKMLERVEKISFELVRETNEPLGLHVYAVYMSNQGTKNDVGIYVKDLVPNSLCEKSGMIKSDDLIIEVNGISLLGEKVEKLNEAVKAGGKIVKFTIGRQPPELEA